MTEERYFGAQCASCGANMAHNPCCGRAEVLAARLDEARARAERAEREALINRVAVSDIAARADKLAAALREIEGDGSGCIDGCCHHAFRATRIAARALADGEGK